MVCRNCGKTSSADSEICQYCGTKLEVPANATPISSGFFSTPGDLSVKAPAPKMTATAREYCQKCGAELPPNSNFCVVCGNSNHNTRAENHGYDSNTSKKKLVIISSIFCTLAFVFLALAVVILSFNRTNTPENAVTKPSLQDSNTLTENKESSFPSVHVGDVITFGTYEQDNNISNGSEAIEWQVLDIDGNQALIISKFALDCQQYNTEWAESEWETCWLRTWMNGTFINAAFSREEQMRILDTNVSADINPEYSQNVGANTVDKIFALSIIEACKYFTSDESRKCELTEYAKANGAWSSQKNECWWWTRTPGGLNINTAVVDYDGSIYYRGPNCDDTNGCVRPAMWINLEQ